MLLSKKILTGSQLDLGNSVRHSRSSERSIYTQSSERFLFFNFNYLQCLCLLGKLSTLAQSFNSLPSFNMAIGWNSSLTPSLRGDTLFNKPYIKMYIENYLYLVISMREKSSELRWYPHWLTDTTADSFNFLTPQRCYCCIIWSPSQRE